MRVAAGSKGSAMAAGNEEQQLAADSGEEKMGGQVHYRWKMAAVRRESAGWLEQEGADELSWGQVCRRRNKEKQGKRRVVLGRGAGGLAGLLDK